MYSLHVDAAITADQFEMLLNDPRLESTEPSIKEDILAFKNATAKHGGLLGFRQVATIANVNPSTITRHVNAGRFTVYELVGMKLLPLDEVMTYLKLRNEELLSKGGGGLKSPKFKDLLKI